MPALSPFCIHQETWKSKAVPFDAKLFSNLRASPFIDFWQWTPFVILIMLAALRSLPEEPFEAAVVSGKNLDNAVYAAEELGRMEAKFAIGA